MGDQYVLPVSTEINSVFGLLNSVVLGDVADVLEVHAVSIYRFENCTTETFTISPTITRYKNLITEFMSIIDQSEKL
jgi:hypothetical protein